MAGYLEEITLTMLDQTTLIVKVDVSSGPQALIWGNRIFIRQANYGTGIYYNEVNAITINPSN